MVFPDRPLHVGHLETAFPEAILRMLRWSLYRRCTARSGGCCKSSAVEPRGGAALALDRRVGTTDRCSQCTPRPDPFRYWRQHAFDPQPVPYPHR
jgi:hypothetical protein